MPLEHQLPWCNVNAFDSEPSDLSLYLGGTHSLRKRPDQSSSSARIMKSNHARGLGMLLWCVPEGGRASLANSLKEKCLLGGVFEKQQWFLRLFPLISLRPDRGHFQIGDMYPQNCPFSLSFWPVQAALFSIKFSVVSVHLYLSLSISVICFRHLCLSLSISVLYLCYLCLCHLCLYLSSSLSISPLLPAPSHPAFKSISPFFPFQEE